MKTIKYVFLLAIMYSFNAKSQVPNASFEQLNSTGSVQHWGLAMLLSAWVDSNGVFHGDSIVIDQSYCQTSTDAHTGLRAIEMRNAYNYTTNTAIAGGAFSSDDTIFSTYSTFVPIQTRPTHLNFYYKYFPVNTDSASAWIEVYDVGSNLIGSAKIILSGTTMSYTYASTPINYTSTDSAATMIIHFNSSIRNVNAQFGTRFLVDDVSLDAPTAIQNIETNQNVLVYPNPTRDILFIKSFKNIQSITVFNMMGQFVTQQIGNISILDCSQYATGQYQLHINTELGECIKRIWVEHQ